MVEIPRVNGPAHEFLTEPKTLKSLTRKVELLFGDAAPYTVTRSSHDGERVRLGIIQRMETGNDRFCAVGVLHVPSVNVLYVEMMTPSTEGAHIKNGPLGIEEPMNVVTAIHLATGETTEETYTHDWQRIGNFPNPDPAKEVNRLLATVLGPRNFQRIEDYADMDLAHVFIDPDLH